MIGSASAATGSSRILPKGGGALSDSLFLLLVVTLSVAPYISGLGFYGDDWAFLGALVNADNQSFGSMWDVQYAQSANLGRRPTQIVYQSLLFRAFALNPRGYHIVNAAVLASAALLLYFVLREFDLERVIAVAIAVVYVLLPNYSTDRFWFAAFTYPLTITLFLLSVYAFVRAIRSRFVECWILLGVASLGAALLGNELVVPFAAALPVVLWVRERHLATDRSIRLARVRRGAVFLSPLIVIVPAVFYKSTFVARSAIPDVFYVAFLGIGSVAVNVGTYGIGLPHTVSWALSHLTWGELALGTVLAVLTFSYLSFISRSIAPRALLSRWTEIALLGTAIFVLGAAIFLIAPIVAFWSAGVANRVWIAASVGMAFGWVALSGWLSSWLSNWTRYNRAFAALVASVCVAGFVINSALSGFWVSAWRRQLDVLDDIRAAVPKMEHGTDFILDGVCPYVGPAIVFESNWDLAGALRIVYRDLTIRADVTALDFSIGEDGLRTQLYGKSYFHAYNDNLLLFDHGTRTVRRLTNAGDARRYLSERAECPEGAAGRGALILPVDVWYEKGFRLWR